MANDSQQIRVEVAYALPEKQDIIELKVVPGCTARQAVRDSGISSRFSEIDPEAATLGVFSKVLDGKTLPLPEDYVLEDGDRVEIYRPLQLDPKESRVLRAQKAKAKKQEAGAVDAEE
ncbi:MAG: RnfH family protein [Pseudomonadales bacterium]|nr:RnfH family protein [Pseudomonadales bacterium]